MVTVLKDEQRDLLRDARSLMQHSAPQQEIDGRTRRRVWDLIDFSTWSQVTRPVRVVVSQETTVTRRQLDGKRQATESEWVWVTTLSPHRARTAAVIRLGHARWGIENEGFNETVNR